MGNCSTSSRTISYYESMLGPILNCRKLYWLQCCLIKFFCFRAMGYPGSAVPDTLHAFSADMNAHRHTCRSREQEMQRCISTLIARALVSCRGVDVGLTF